MTSGTKLGPYEIIAHIAAGDIGEVYKAAARASFAWWRSIEALPTPHRPGRARHCATLQLPSPTKMSG
jgi:hypothetical protein